ncbi:MAG: efflux RND transporter periplasmic adaptor subunit [Gammaproteobacteria bacterium]|nr:efflux RND transporter periplasmic adaptor subunit [Gammaproteobacteria bacterium]
MNWRHFRPLAAVSFGAVLVLLAGCGGDGPETVTGERVVAVTVTEAAREDVQVELYSIGRLVSKNTPTLAAEIDARVLEFLVDEGQQVLEGQELVQLDTTTVELTRREALADIQRLEVSIANEVRRVERYRDLKTRDMMPQERLDDAEAKLAVDRASLAAAQARLAIAEDRLAKAHPHSPVTGVVEKRHVSAGDYVRVGGPLITVTDTVSLRAELPFPETVGAQLAVGQTLFLGSPVAPGVKVEAAIEQIMPQVGAMSRAMVVTADVTNPGSWKPEATVEARVVVDRRPGAVVVPALSIVRRPAGDVVYVLETPGADTVRQQVVEVGQRQDGWVEITRGLEAGARVVAEGAYYLTDGARVAVRESGQ